MTAAENHSGDSGRIGPIFLPVRALPTACGDRDSDIGSGACARYASAPARRAAPRDLVVYFAAAVLLLAGCTSTGASSPSRGERLSAGLSAEEIIETLPAWPPELDTLTADADVQVSSPEETGRFRAIIAYRRADSMLIRVRFPLGIEGARVLVTKDSAFVYDRIENVVIAGTPDAVSSALPVAVAGANLVEMATGFYKPDAATGWEIIADSVQLALERSDGRVRMIIDPERWRVTNLRFLDPAGTVIEERWYQDFTLFNQTLLPRRMSLSRPTEDTRLTMVLRGLDSTPGRMSFELGIDPDARRIRLD